MTVTLSQPYGSNASGASVDLDNATEAALVAQGRALYSVNPGSLFYPLTATEQQNVRDNNAATSGYPSLTSAQAAAVTKSYNSAAGVIGGVNPRYFTHLFAGNQLTVDPVVYDISGALGTATPEADLVTKGGLFTTTAGYACTLDPAAGAGNTLTRLMLPSFNWDYAGGQSLFMWWLGIATKEAASCSIISNSINASSQNGIRVRVATTGAMTPTINEGTTTRTASSTTLLPFDGSLHSFGVWINASERKVYTYVDETVQVGGAAWASLNTLPTAAQIAAGEDLLRIGGDPATSGGATTGLATATRALAILILNSTDTIPTSAQVITMMKALRAAPHLPLAIGYP